MEHTEADEPIGQQSKSLQVVWFIAQGFCGLVIGAVLWTAFQLAVPDVGHWMVNALVLAPITLVLIALFIQSRWPSVRVFGWSMVAGAVVYGYLFSILVLANLHW